MSIAFPGYVPDVHAADALDPAWGNAIRDRANQVFTTAALRDAAITVPQVGQQAILTAAASGSDTGVYVYVGATDGWRRPWNMPWGEVARTIWSTSQSNADSTEHVVTAAATTFTAVANRVYRITVRTTERNLAATTQAIQSTIKDGTNIIEGAQAWAVPTVTDLAASYSVETVLTAGAHTINLTHKSASATGVANNSPTTQQALWVDDIGPCGAPS